MTEKNITNCTLCENQCPINDLKCGRGRLFLAALQGDEQAKKTLEEIKEKGHGFHHSGHGGFRHHGDCGENGGSELEKILGKCMRFLQHHLHRGGGKGKIIHILAKRESLTQKELQDILEIKPGSVSEIISKLEDKGLIKRQKDEEDKRKVVLHITEQGKKFAKEHLERKNSENIFAGLTEDEQEQLKTLLKKLLNSWLQQKNERMK